MSSKLAAFVASPDCYFAAVWAVEFCCFFCWGYGSVAAGANWCLNLGCGFGCSAHGSYVLCFLSADAISLACLYLLCSNNYSVLDFSVSIICLSNYLIKRES